MIPQRLTLRNFLSYREATLDFRGLHTACICGSNGAGKSSLLEAIAWAIWGESRVASEDDVIHLGEKEAQVDFLFISSQHLYRILRGRHRGQATVLEFQVAQDDFEELAAAPTFRSLTAKSVRATQALILEHIKLDYETFINSAYLRQGHADEFMVKRPSDRKQILADLLKLDRYDDLAEQAKDQARQFKGQMELLERSLTTIQQQLQQQEHLAQEQAALEEGLAETQEQQAIDFAELQQLQSQQQQRQTWQQQLTWQQQQQRTLEQDCQRLQQELASAQRQQQELEELIQQEETIAAGYAHWQTLQTQEEAMAARFKAHQVAESQRQQYQQQQSTRIAELQAKRQQAQAQLEALQQQEAEIQQTLGKAADVETALGQLQRARMQLARLDQLQVEVSPLLQRRQQLQNDLDRAATRLHTRLEELRTSTRQAQAQWERQSTLQVVIQSVSDRIATLEERKAYQEEVRDRGLERRTFMEGLQAHQRECEKQLAEIAQKVRWLQQGSIPTEPIESAEEPQRELLLRVSERQEGQYRLALSPSTFPPCPLCDRPLDEHHWRLVLEKQQTRQEEILDQLWVIREQLSASEREMQLLREEYKTLDQELAEYAPVLERRGQLQEQLQTATELEITLQQLAAETAAIEQSLADQTYAADLHHELRLLDDRLQELDYDERTHALVRGEVDRWRWAEIRQAEIRQAQRRQSQIQQRKPGLQSELADVQNHLEQINAQMTQYFAVLDQHIAEIGYSARQHSELRTNLKQAQSWQFHYQELWRSRQTYPQVQQRVAELEQTLQERQQQRQALQQQVADRQEQLAAMPDSQTLMPVLEQRMQQRRSQINEQLAQLGRLQQQQQQREALRSQSTALSEQLQTAQRQFRVYQELAQAFGKNGIQTLMIENVLPQLEAETNQILSRLSANQLHVQFVTQKSNRRDTSRSTKQKTQPAKLIETLDILIADTRGTRPYETYSGGEAFRVNFAIRLALSRLLAQRSGTSLQLLIIDEGFGTQDGEGCDRLIAAINAIAPDFACILTVTHVPHFKEAFQSRIEVYKAETGSQLITV